jgi:beta-glucosidase
MRPARSSSQRVAVWTSLLAAVSALLLAAQLPAATAAPQPWMNRSLPPDQRADLVEAQMTVAEKVSLATGKVLCLGSGGDGMVPGIPRLGIPDLKLKGAGMGVTDLCGALFGDSLRSKATMLPAPIAMAASWDPGLAYEDGALIGAETRDLGFNVSIGGDVNLARDPRNGRTFEAEGEDPYLAGTTVAAQLRGTESAHIPATIKHFALNNEETHRLTASSNVDERTMRELELRTFEIGIERSGVSAVMCAYNKVNGTPSCENQHLLRDVLKGDWGFRGWVMSDWWACAPPAVFDPADMCQTAQAADAGLDQQQPNGTYYGAALLTAVTAGAVPQARLDEMVHRILRSLFASGVIDDPPVARPLDVHEGAAVARRIEEQSAVLLRNEGGALPLKRSGTRTIAVIGAPANATPPQADGSFPGSSARVNPIAPDKPLEGIEDEAPGAEVRFEDGSDPARAAALAAQSDVAIVYARDTEAEGADRANLALDGNADGLITAVAAANPRTVVVLMTGSAVTMPWLGRVPAVLEAWYPGERGGHAIARLLFGDVNPSGRLPLTFPVSEADLATAGSPARWPGDAHNIDYDEGLLLGYRWYDAKRIAPLFPFGFGLSYGGRFRYSHLRITPKSTARPGTVRDGHRLAKVRFRLTNTGTRAASETAQIYAGFPASAGEPPKRLVAFRKIQLRPRHGAVVRAAIDDRSLAYWDTARGGWAIAPGDYPIWVGSSSRDLHLQGTLHLRGG